MIRRPEGCGGAEGLSNSGQNEDVSTQVPAENLNVGDLVELSTMFGPRILRLAEIRPRVNGIKFIGINDDGTRTSFGMKYGQLATLPEPR
jgi:hypothetical protein